MLRCQRTGSWGQNAALPADWQLGQNAALPADWQLGQNAALPADRLLGTECCSASGRALLPILTRYAGDKVMR